MATLRLPPLPSTREIIKLYKLNAKKNLAQNFLLDENLTNKIVKKAGDLSACDVLEVGPGPGGITRSILRKYPKRLIVVEKDIRFKPTLNMLAEAYTAINGKMEILFDDILRINLQSVFSDIEKTEWEDKAPKIHLIGNLPFNVSTHLIIRWLQAISEKTGPWSFGRTRMTLTFQKEVAERLTAPPYDDQRCRLSVMAQAWTKPLLRFVIPGKAFVPEPKVDVGVVTFLPLKEPFTKHEFKLFEKVTRQTFIFRQKNCIKGIGTLFPMHLREELSLMMFKLTDINPAAKPFHLSVEEFDRLVTAYKYLAEKHPEITQYEYRASRKLLPLYALSNLNVNEYIEE